MPFSGTSGETTQYGHFTESSGRGIIERSLRAAGIAAEHQFHCNRIKKRRKSAFDRFIGLLADELTAAKLQPTRIVNGEGVSYGDRVANYTNILAEFLVRVCRQVSSDSADGVALNVYAARVRGDEDDKGVFEIFDKAEYVARVQEYFARAAVRTRPRACPSRKLADCYTPRTRVRC